MRQLLSSKQGKELVKNLGLTYKDLFCFETFEPFFHIGIAKDAFQNILIVENLDTFFSLKELYSKHIRSWVNINFALL